MNKVIVKLYIPYLEQQYDVKIPTFLTVGEVVKMLAKAIVTLSDGKYHTDGTEILCVKNRNILSNSTRLLSEYGIQNGDELVLI